MRFKRSLSIVLVMVYNFRLSVLLRLTAQTLTPIIIHYKRCFFVLDSVVSVLRAFIVVNIPIVQLYRYPRIVLAKVVIVVYLRQSYLLILGCLLLYWLRKGSWVSGRLLTGGRVNGTFHWQVILHLPLRTIELGIFLLSRVTMAHKLIIRGIQSVFGELSLLLVHFTLFRSWVCLIMGLILLLIFSVDFQNL